MGQYWYPVNLDKREFVHPHKMGCGLKLWEQLVNHPGTGAALIVLTAAMPQARGGGDLKADPIIGRWAGDRIAIIGDYAEDDDLKDSPIPASKIYESCSRGAIHKCSQCDDVGTYYDGGVAVSCSCLTAQPGPARRGLVLTDSRLEPWTDISDEVCKVIEREFKGTFSGDGWRKFEGEFS